MKILQIIQKPQLRGAEIFASQLSIQLIAMGHHVDLIYLYDNETFDLNFKLNYRPLKGNSKRRFYDFFAFKRLNKIIRSEDYDIVQANAGDTLKYVVFSKILFGWQTPIVYRNANLASGFLKNRWIFKLNHMLVNKVDHVASVSTLCRLDFIQTFDYPNHKITTLPIGVENVPEYYDIPDDLAEHFDRNIVFVNVASLVPEKNHTGLIRLFKTYKTQGGKGILLIVGDGRERGNLLGLIKNNQLSEDVFLLGYRKDVMSILYHSKALLLPSLIEGLPGVILEAMSLNTLVIAYNVGGISEVVTDETGYLIEKNDSPSFIRAMNKSIQSEYSARKIRFAKKMINDNYNIKNIAANFYGVYQNLMDLNDKF